ncbi:MAG TPA: chloride channel protein [Bacteroidales bacterium]|nr:chloride channel protein [Bacteroidales bacterium]HQH19451.1 chloride channel protein [Bacteroidales bacterium]HQI44970.1 chloride channel protein [Bacteroidales bacterium]
MRELNFIRKINIWRVKNVDEKKFIFFLSILIGFIAGLAAVLLKTSVHYIETFFRNYKNIQIQNEYYIILPFIGILITVLFIRFFIKDDISHGVTKILYAISRKNSKIKKHNTYSSIVSCSFTGGFGGSVGMEAPILYTGAAIGSNVGALFHLNYKTLTLLIGCGVAGALSAIFKAPITGLIFVFEVLMLDLTTASLIPILISTVTGAIVSSLLLGKQIEFYFTIKDVFNFNNIPFYILLGIVAGFISLYFVRISSWIERIFKRDNNPFRKLIIGALILGCMIYFFPPLYGEGYSSMKSILSGNTQELLNHSILVNWGNNSWGFLLFLTILVFLKVIAMAITTGSGGIGGVFAPSLFVGGVTGFAFARVINLTFPSWLNLTESNFTLVGMAGIVTGVMQAPLTAIFLIAEITGGYTLFIPLIITSSISYITIHQFEKYSIYAKRLAEKGDLIAHDKDKVVLTHLKVENVIEKNFIPVDVEAKLGDLVDIIAKSKRNIFPVIDNQYHFMGMIMLDDVREVMFNKEDYNRLLVKDFMIQPPEHITLSDHMEVVMNKFKTSGLWNLPVIEDNRYIGFVSRSMVFNIYRKKLIEFAEE